MSLEVWAVRLGSCGRVFVVFLGFGVILYGAWRALGTAAAARDAAVLMGQPIRTVVGSGLMADAAVIGIGIIIVWLAYR